MRRIYVLMIILFVPLFTMGQKNIRKTKIRPTKEVKKIDERTERMLSATQKVFFVDSLVVNKEEFLNKYILTKEAGKLCKYNELFEADDTQYGSFAHVNEMGNKCYYAIENNNGRTKLYTSDRLNNAWTAPIALEGLDGDGGIENMNYPFMMADGVTMYFAATGKESIGGYDIFATRLDPDTEMFFEPENIGMPFNSEANDYMYVIDEINNIGWFATDRNQPAGKVCIYTFIPSETRETYSPDLYSRDEIESLARIMRIEDTWQSLKERDDALDRIKAISKKKDNRQADSFLFVINDNITYKKTSDFQLSENANNFRELRTMKARLEKLEIDLDKARNHYATANAREKKILKADILKGEMLLENLTKHIRQTEKTIRNSENELLKR